MFTTIPISQVDQYIDGGFDMMLIDLRNPQAYAGGHIEGAVNLPYEEMSRWEGSLPADKTLVFYCARGGQSMMACRYLERKGYSVVDTVNGFDHYRGKYLAQMWDWH